VPDTFPVRAPGVAESWAKDGPSASEMSVRFRLTERIPRIGKTRHALRVTAVHPPPAPPRGRRLLRARRRGRGGLPPSDRGAGGPGRALRGHRLRLRGGGPLLGRGPAPRGDVLLRAVPRHRRG